MQIDPTRWATIKEFMGMEITLGQVLIGLISGLAAILASILAYQWRVMDRRLNNHSSRLGELEKQQLRRDEFNDAMMALRRERKEEIEIISTQLREISTNVVGRLSSIETEIRVRVEMSNKQVEQMQDRLMSLSNPRRKGI